MSECTNGELRDLLPELVNDRLDAELRQRVEAHVASCADCADELALLRSLRPALARGPVVDTQRIAAAVLAQATAGPKRASARATTSTATISTRWRLAIAAAALLAAGALGYVVKTHRGVGAPEVAVVPAPERGSEDTGKAPHSAPQPSHEPVSATPSSAPVHTPQRESAAAPSHGTTSSATTSFASTGVLENVSDLSDDQLRALTASLDNLSAIPEADASPGLDPLGASLDDATSGGR